VRYATGGPLALYFLRQNTPDIDDMSDLLEFGAGFANVN
jgi:hypothetical protein